MINGSLKGNASSSDLDTVERAVGSLDELFVSNGVDRYVCNRDDLVLPANAQLLLRGWAANSSGNGPADRLRLLLDGSEVAARYGESRDDVALAFGKASMRATGFRAVVDTRGLSPGSHRLHLLFDDEVTRELEPLSFRIDETYESAPLRKNQYGLFEIEVERFHSARDPASLDARIERRFTAVVAGRLRERGNSTLGARIYGIVDGFEGTFGQLGWGPEGDRFTLFFQTAHLTLGRHSLELIATTVDNKLERVATLAFSVVPVCCGPGEPIEQPVAAPAEIDWVDTASASAPAFGGDEIAFVRGWALDPVTGDAAGNIFLEIDGAFSVQMRARQYREDLFESGKSAAPFCGFVGCIAFAQLPRGRHIARIVIESKDRHRRHQSDATLTFDVRA